MKTTRIQFIQSALSFCVAGVTLAACGGDDDDDDDGGDPSGSGGTSTGGGTGGGACGASIATNHGHKITVTKAQATAGAAKTYDIQGDSMHSHTVDISAAQMANLAAGDAVTVESSTDAGHSHSVAITCA